MPIPMLKNNPGSGTGDYTPVPEGTYQAIVQNLFFIGTQPSLNPKYKPAQKLVIRFIIDEPLGEQSDKFYSISTTVGFSLSEKSGLTKLFKPVLGSGWPPEGGTLDPETLLNLRVMVTITHTAKGDKTYANVASLGRLPRGMAPFDPNCDIFAWSYDDPPRDGVPEWIIKQAAQCHELTGQSAPAKEYRAPAPGGHKIDPTAEDAPF
jgi:hypothetical protein